MPITILFFVSKSLVNHVKVSTSVIDSVGITISSNFLELRGHEIGIVEPSYRHINPVFKRFSSFVSSKDLSKKP